MAKREGGGMSDKRISNEEIRHNKIINLKPKKNYKKAFKKITLDLESLSTKQVRDRICISCSSYDSNTKYICAGNKCLEAIRNFYLKEV